MTDEELLGELRRIVGQERENTVSVLRLLAEVDRRRLVDKTSTPSLFVYCVKELGYAEGAAYRRIRTARCARQFPRIYALLRRGRVSLTTVSLLAPHLNRDNYRRLLREASGMTRYEVERLVAGLDPKPETRERIRPLGPGRPIVPTAAAAAGEADDLFSALAATPEPGLPAPWQDPQPARVEFRFTADESLLDRIRRAKEVLWHKYPAGRLEDIVGEAVEALLERRDPARRYGRLKRRRAARVQAAH
ncbi:MAG: hypothetical protein HY928_10290 [Elusimicrobia bacterium]|nr:hypothetical protein [Elusimicrobiota bacterium]